MLAAFSFAWYCSIWKMLRTRRACGKSIMYVIIISFGYLCGIASKVSLHASTGELSGLVFLYTWNLLVTAFDACLVCYFTRRTRLAEAGARQSGFAPDRRRQATVV